MNDDRSQQCHGWSRTLAAIGLIMFAGVLAHGFGVDAEPPRASSLELTRCEDILRQAGATPAKLAGFEKEMKEASPAQIAQLEGYLLQQSPVQRALFVHQLPASPDDQYVRGPDSLPQPGTPQGKIFDFTFDHSKIFPGTTRKITVYVPAEYTPDKPACVYVGLDGLGFAAPTVFDNLIYKHEMPITIAVGIAPGTVDSADPPHSPRFNRSFEFDGLNDNLARFVVEEVLPEVERHETPDGRPIRLSKDANDRAAGGGSTGGIAAFTLAWERPDAFGRVFTAIGTFVGMRGGDRYPVLVRKTEPKPIRIYMQDGSNDEWMGGPEVGDWWMSNQTMERALEFSGYQVRHTWGEGTHSDNQATAVFPDAMRWLWKDWPQPITAGESQNLFLKAILLPGAGWQAVAGISQSDGILATDAEGAIVFLDATSGRPHWLSGDGELKTVLGLDDAYAGLAFGPDGRAFVSRDDKILVYRPKGQPTVLARGIRTQHLVVTHDNKVYLTESGTGDADGKVWLIQPNGDKMQLDSGLNHPTGIALSPDGLWLAVAEHNTHFGYSYRVQPDGSVEDKQRFYWFHVPDDADDSGAGAWVMDRDGRLYAATRMGVQVFDRNGRVRAILPVPGGEVTGLSFGGTNFDELYVSCSDHRIYRRKLKIAGAQPWAAPIELTRWSPG